jgi:hypothetical protein
MTFVHFSVSTRQNLVKSWGEPIFGLALSEARLQLGRTQDFTNRRVEHIHDICRSAHRGNDPRPVPCSVGKPLSTVVGTGRKLVAAHVVGYGKGLYFCGMNMRQKQCDRVGIHLHLPGDQVRDGLLGTLVGNVHTVGASRLNISPSR